MPCKICKTIGHNSRTCQSAVKETCIIPKHYCYILQQIPVKGKKSLNYIGYTVNYGRRIRQHNDEIKGGARYTHGRGPWEFIAILFSSSWNNIRGLQIEWLLKHPTRKRKRDKRFNGSIGKILSLVEVCKRLPSDEEVAIYVHPEFLEMSLNLGLPKNVRILSEISFF
jgi:predicted GIY-YIG superfamily endonuclease